LTLLCWFTHANVNLGLCFFIIPSQQYADNVAVLLSDRPMAIFRITRWLCDDVSIGEISDYLREIIVPAV
jgi:hypothetical protein